MIDTFRKIRDLLDARERRNAVLLFGMMLVMGLLETIGVASIMPFFAVVSNSEMVHTNVYLAAVYEGLGFTSTDGFLLFLGTSVFALVLVGDQDTQFLEPSRELADGIRDAKLIVVRDAHHQPQFEARKVSLQAVHAHLASARAD